MKAVHYDYLINDGNSKVWMIQQMIVNKSNITAQKDAQKELLIFFGTGRFQYIPIKQLGHKSGEVGSYFVFSSEKVVKMYFKEAIWKFKMKEISEDSIYLEPVKGSDAKFSMLLVPLKEIQI
jgi:hypothetical protein